MNEQIDFEYARDLNKFLIEKGYKSIHRSPQRFLLVYHPSKNNRCNVYIGVWLACKYNDATRHGIAISSTDSNEKWIDREDPNCFQKIVDYIEEEFKANTKINTDNI